MEGKNNNEEKKKRRMLSKQSIKAIIFNEKSLKNLGQEIDIRTGLLALFFIALIFSIPTDVGSLAAQVWLRNFAVVLGLFFVLFCVVFLIALLFRMKTSFWSFFNAINTTLALSLLLVSAPLFLITYSLRNELFSLVLFSLIPYYNYVLFGWACEVSSELKGKKAIVLALIAMTLIFLFHYLLRYVVI